MGAGAVTTVEQADAIIQSLTGLPPDNEHRLEIAKDVAWTLLNAVGFLHGVKNGYGGGS